eukprot:7086987-Prymnesium_polylepis.1
MSDAAHCKEEGNACMSVGDYVNAMKWYSQAMALAPKGDLGALHSNRSFAFLRLKLTSRALEDADIAVKLKPGWAKAHFRRAEALSQAGLHAEALEEYAHGAALDPDDEHLRAQCEAARVRGVAAKRREFMMTALGVAVGVFLALVLVAAPAEVGKPAPGVAVSIFGIA